MNYEKRDAIINMYLKEKMTADQISDETGYSLSTIKKVLSSEYVSKRSNESEKKKEDKPYKEITDDLVEYKGKKCRILSKDELRDELADALNIK